VRRRIPVTPTISLPPIDELLVQPEELKPKAKKTKKQPPPTTEELLTRAQQLTGTHYFPGLDPVDLSTGPSLEEMLAEHKASVDELAVPFSIYHDDLSKATPQSVRWLWQNRLSLAGITLLDGDHGTAAISPTPEPASSLKSCPCGAHGPGCQCII
jgi:hypothetical protein